MLRQETKVLLVEDNPADADLVRSLLADGLEHFDIHWAKRLAAALDFRATGDCDVVLLDLTLPDSRGLETFERMRTAISAPIVILTGLKDEGLGLKAVQGGAQDYLPKGDLNAALLTRAIRYAIERSRSEEALRLNEERYALAVQGAQQGVWDWDVATDRIYYSPGWKAMLGYPPAEIGDGPSEWLSRVHPEDLQSLQADIEALRDSTLHQLEHEFRALTKNGEYRWMLVRALGVRDAAGRVCRIVGAQSDISERKRSELQLQHNALHDSLTGLPNRALFLDRLNVAVAREARRAQGAAGLAVMFLDLDDFKLINDVMGHLLGDQLLVQFGQRLQAAVRPSDTVARLSGDEFAVLLDEVEDSAEAEQIAARIMEQLQPPFNLGMQEITLTSSLGIAVCTGSTCVAKELIRDADSAMYRAKKKGGSRLAVFDRSMLERAPEVLRSQDHLRRALKERRLSLYYQPILCPRTYRLVGFEALLRWKPVDGLPTLPGEFIGIAERTGLIVPITYWVIEEACAQLEAWRKTLLRADSLSVSVNLSTKNLRHPDLVDRIEAALKNSGIGQDHLCVEITESAIMDDPVSAARVLGSLRDLGVGIHLDDFGEGYSCLSQVCELPLDVVKVDRTIVGQIEFNQRSLEVVRAIVALGHSLRMKVVAEGVETQQQLDQLITLGCDYVQGYLFSEPVSDVEPLLVRYAGRALSNGIVSMVRSGLSTE